MSRCPLCGHRGAATEDGACPACGMRVVGGPAAQTEPERTARAPDRPAPARGVHLSPFKEQDTQVDAEVTTAVVTEPALVDAPTVLRAPEPSALAATRGGGAAPPPTPVADAAPVVPAPVDTLVSALTASDDLPWEPASEPASRWLALDYGDDAAPGEEVRVRLQHEADGACFIVADTQSIGEGELELATSGLHDLDAWRRASPSESAETYERVFEFNPRDVLSLELATPGPAVAAAPAPTALAPQVGGSPAPTAPVCAHHALPVELSCLKCGAAICAACGHVRVNHLPWCTTCAGPYLPSAGRFVLDLAVTIAKLTLVVAVILACLRFLPNLIIGIVAAVAGAWVAVKLLFLGDRTELQVEEVRPEATSIGSGDAHPGSEPGRSF